MKMRWIRSLWLAPALLVACAGCGGGDSGPGLNPVRGVVTKSGAPLADAVVTFYATDPQALSSGVPVPKGRTDSEGVFELRTFDPGDGAKAGEYAVTIKHVQSVDTPDGQLIEQDLLKGAYADRDKPFKVVTVTDGTNDLGTLAIP